MLKVIDLVYYSHNDHDKPQEVLKIHAPATGFAAFIKERVDIQFVKHLDYEGTEIINDIKYSFFKSRNKSWYIPFKTHRYLKNQKPDIVMVEGLIFPLQLIFLQWKLGKKTKIIAQHHNERPFDGARGFFQKNADRFIDKYLFTSLADVKEWIDKGIIKNINKCRESLEASTYFRRVDKKESQAKVGMSGENNFLWVGSLSIVKDPVTVLNAFEKFAAANSEARLYMIYQEETLLKEVKKIIEQSKPLKNAVRLIGKIDHDKLPYWYSAADFYISGSNREATSYSLLEAMACGCIPIVTAIPSFRKITAGGEYGFLYSPGDDDALTVLLSNIKNINALEFSSKVQKHFNESLSFKKIADDLYRIFNETAAPLNTGFPK